VIMAISIVISFLLLFGLSIPLFPHAAFGADQQQHATVMVDGACGKEYGISYTITGGAVVSEINADPAVFALTVSLAESNEEGTLEITIPQQLIPDGNAGRYPDLVVFIDEVPMEYNIQNTTEDNITLDVGFQTGAKTIGRIGGYILAFVPYANNLTIDVEGRQFPVNTYKAHICGYEFSAEQKKLTIYSDNSTWGIWVSRSWQ